MSSPPCPFATGPATSPDPLKVEDERVIDRKAAPKKDEAPSMFVKQRDVLLLCLRSKKRKSP